MSRYQKPVFIVGCQRSGTTLLQSMLSRSPEVVAVPETFFFEMFKPPLYPYRAWPIHSKGPEKPITPNNIADWTSNLQRFDIRHVPFEGAQNGCEILERIVDAYNKDGQTRFVEKSTYHLYYKNEILAMYPDAKIVAIVRNPYDTVASMRTLLHMQGKAKRSIAELTNAWKQANRTIANNNLCYVRYEDLVESPEKALTKVCEHCELPFIPEMINDFSSVASVVVTGPENKWKENVYKGLSNKSGKGKRLLSPTERGLISRLATPTMSLFGYQPDSAHADNTALGNDLLRFAPIWLKATSYIAMRKLQLALRKK